MERKNVFVPKAFLICFVTGPLSSVPARGVHTEACVSAWVVEWLNCYTNLHAGIWFMFTSGTTQFKYVSRVVNHERAQS